MKFVIAVMLVVCSFGMSTAGATYAGPPSATLTPSTNLINGQGDVNLNGTAWKVDNHRKDVAAIRYMECTPAAKGKYNSKWCTTNETSGYRVLEADWGPIEIYPVVGPVGSAGGACGTTVDNLTCTILVLGVDHYENFVKSQHVAITVTFATP